MLADIVCNYVIYLYMLVFLLYNRTLIITWFWKCIKIWLRKIRIIVFRFNRLKISRCEKITCYQFWISTIYGKCHWTSTRESHWKLKEKWSFHGKSNRERTCKTILDDLAKIYERKSLAIQLFYEVVIVTQIERK